MAAEKILIALIFSLTLPHIGLGRLLVKFNYRNLCEDLALCISVVDSHEFAAPPAFISALRKAEDHRNEMHFGIDPFAIARAAIIRLSTNEIQGASTIDQQFVRVATNRYERTFKRKIREQVLATLLRQARPAESIASAYLSVAFFGSGLIGIERLRDRIGVNVSNASVAEATAVIAQLKYPRPLTPSEAWHGKIDRRLLALSAHKRGLARINLFARKK